MIEINSQGTLYIVATPIGNLGDLTDRAKATLKGADIIACEDTRVSMPLLKNIGAEGRFVSYHKFSEHDRCEYLLSELEGGKNVAIISDAGTPGVSDPGAVIVRAAAGRGITVTSVPGACAAAAALSVSGFNETSFAFYGFMPRTVGEIRLRLSGAVGNSAGIKIFYESPRRIIGTMKILSGEYPEANVCLCNDLTKLHERIYRGSPSEVLRELEENTAAEKGEYTLVFTAKPPVNEGNTVLRPEALLVQRMAEYGETVKEAVSALTDEYKGKGYAKKDFYSASLKLKDMF